MREHSARKGYYWATASTLSTIVLLLISGCQTTSIIRTKSVGEIPLPQAEARLVLDFGKNDIEVLGDIDVVRKIATKPHSSSPLPSMDKTTVEKNLGQLATNVPLIVASSIQASEFGGNVQDSLINSMVYEVIEKYPNIDYILFPKLIVERTVSTGNIDDNSLQVELKGKAIRIKL